MFYFLAGASAFFLVKLQAPTKIPCTKRRKSFDPSARTPVPSFFLKWRIFVEPQHNKFIFLIETHQHSFIINWACLEMLKTIPRYGIPLTLLAYNDRSTLGWFPRTKIYAIFGEWYPPKGIFYPIWIIFAQFVCNVLKIIPTDWIFWPNYLR